MIPFNTFGAVKVLKSRILRDGTVMASLCEGAGMRMKTLKTVFMGRRKLKADELMKLCDVLNMD